MGRRHRVAIGVEQRACKQAWLPSAYYTRAALSGVARELRLNHIAIVYGRDQPPDPALPHRGQLELEDVSFLFQEDVPGKTSFSDDWLATS